MATGGLAPLTTVSAVDGWRLTGTRDRRCHVGPDTGSMTRLSLHTDGEARAEPSRQVTAAPLFF